MRKIIADLIIRTDGMVKEHRDKLSKTTHETHKPVYEAKIHALTACREILENPGDLEKLQALKDTYKAAKNKKGGGANRKLSFFEQVNNKDSDVVDFMAAVICVIDIKNLKPLPVSSTVNAPF